MYTQIYFGRLHDRVDITRVYAVKTRTPGKNNQLYLIHTVPDLTEVRLEELQEFVREFNEEFIIPTNVHNIFLERIPEAVDTTRWVPICIRGSSQP